MCSYRCILLAGRFHIFIVLVILSCNVPGFCRSCRYLCLGTFLVVCILAVLLFSGRFASYLIL